MSDYASMKIAELKKELKAKGLPVSGKKEELIERLEATVDTALLDENDDDLDQDDEQMTEEAIKEAEKELQDPDVSLTEPEPEKAAAPEDSSDDKENTQAEETVKKVTSPAADPAELIKARAERFGGFQSDEAKIAARAARFADMFPAKEAEAAKGSTKIGAAPPPDLDQLKKRAERFGTAVSPLVKQAEVSDAIKRRQERFGIISKDEPKAKKPVFNAGQNSVVLDEKMKARAERFKV